MVRTRRDREHAGRKQQWADEADGNEDYCYDYCRVLEGPSSGINDYEEEVGKSKRQHVRHIIGREERDDSDFHDSIEYEVDYKRNPTQLFRCISHRLWDMAISQLKLDPSEARVWISSSYDDDYNGEDSGGESRHRKKWRNLPLHLALVHAPEPVSLSLVQALLDDYPNACRCRNSEGNLPIHLACDNYSLVNNGVEGEGILFALVEISPDSLLEPDKDGMLPVEILERVGRGKTWRGESIMNFIRHQMLILEEGRMSRHDSMNDYRKDVDREESYSAPVQRRSRSMERPSASARKIEPKHRSRSLDPSKSETSNSRVREQKSRGSKKYSRRRSSQQKASRTRRHRGNDGERRENEEGRRHQYNIYKSSSENESSSSSSSTSDYGKLLFDPENEYERRRNPTPQASKSEKELEAKLARALKDNMSLRCSLEQASVSRQGEKLANALDEIACLRNAIDVLTNDSKDDKRPLRTKAEAELKSMRKNFDMLEEDIKFKVMRAQSQRARIAELEETVRKTQREEERAKDKNATMQGTIEALRDANDLLHRRLEASTKTIETMREKQETLCEKSKRKSGDCEELGARYCQAQSKIDELNGTVAHGQRKIDEYEREVRCLKESNHSQGKKIESIANMNDALREKITTLKDIVKKNSSAYQIRFDSMNEKIELQTDEKNKLENDLKSAQEASILRERRIAELMSMQKDLEERLADNKETIAESEMKIERLEREESALSAQGNELSNLRSKAKAFIDVMQSEKAQRIANSQSKDTKTNACDDMIGQLGAILNASSELLNQKVALQQRLDAMISTRTKEEAKRQDMSTELWASKSQIERLKHTIETLETALDTKDIAVEDTNKASNALYKQIQDAEEKSGKAEAERDRLWQQLSKAKSREEASRTKLAALSGSNKAYEAELSNLMEERLSTQRTITTLETEIAGLKKKLIATNEESVQYIAEIDKYSHRIEEQSANMTNLEEKVADLKAASDSMQSENDRLKSEMNILKSEKNDLVSMQDQLVAEKANLEQSISNLTRQADAQTQTISELETKLSGIEQEYRSVCSERDLLKKEVLACQDLELEKDSLEKAVSSLQSVASDYRSKIQDLNAKFVESKNESRAKIHASKIANKEFEKDVDRLQTEMAGLKTAKQGTEERNAKLLLEKSSLEKALQEATDQNVTMTNQIEGQKQSIRKLEDSLDSMEQMRDSLRLERNTLQSEITQNQKSVVEMKERASQLKTENDSLRESMARMQVEISGHQQTVQELTDTVKARTELENKMSFGDLSREIANHRDKIKHLQAASNEDSLMSGDGYTLRSIVAKWVDQCWEIDEKIGIDTLPESTSKRIAGTSRKWKYECLEGLDLILATNTKVIEETSSASAGQAYMRCDNLLQQVVHYRGGNRQLMSHIQLSGLKRRSDGSTFLQMERNGDGGRGSSGHNGDDDIKIQALSTENSVLKESIMRLRQEVDDLKTRKEGHQLEIERLISANSSLQSKSIELIKVNEGYRASVAALNETLIRRRGRTEESTNKETNGHVTCETKNVQNEPSTSKEDYETRNDQDVSSQPVITETRSEEARIETPTENDLVCNENMTLKRQNSVLEKALIRLTVRTALHQEKTNELAARQVSLERQRAELAPTVLTQPVVKNNVRDRLQANNEESEEIEQRHEVSYFHGERE